MDQNERDALAMGGGGLPDMTVPDQVPVQAVEQLVEAPATAKIVVGDRTFGTTEEAIAYANGLASARAEKAAPHIATVAQVTAAPSIKLGQLLFENPDEAIAQLKAQTKDEMRAEQRVVDETKKFWDDFYTGHPDLKGSELLVDAVLVQGQKSGAYGHMTRAEAAPILAARARQEVLKIRNVPSGGQELSSQPATVASASGLPTPRPQPAKVPATNFVTELAQMRKRG